MNKMHGLLLFFFYFTNLVNIGEESLNTFFSRFLNAVPHKERIVSDIVLDCHQQSLYCSEPVQKNILEQ